MKRTIYVPLIFAFIVTLMFPTNLFAKSTPDLFLNGKLQNVEVVLKDSNTLIPMRFCSEELDANVNWNKSTQEIIVTKGSDTILFKIGSLDYSHNTEARKLLVAPELIDGVTYLPFRPLVEALKGIVLYNNEYKLINIYDANSEACEVYNALANSNVTEKRFAMLELPKKGFPGSYGGSRGDTYIFPTGEAPNYFFRYFSNEGTFYGMDYFEVHDGIAVQKWSQTQSGSTPTSLTQSPLLNYLGSSTEVKEIGVFPSITETSFVGFYNKTFEQSKDTISSTATIGNTVSEINEKGFSRPSPNVPNELIFSPFGSLYYLIEFEEN